MATGLPMYNVVILGPFGVGKTSIASWLTQDTERELRSDKKLLDREYYDVRVTMSNGKGNALVRIYDTCEMEKEKGTSLPTNIFRNKDGFVLVWDIKREETLRELKDWHQSALNYVTEDFFPSFIIFANKAEKEMNTESEEFKRCLKWSEEINVECLKTSSLKGDNLEEGLQLLVDSMSSHSPVYKFRKKAQASVNLSKTETVETKKCCES